MLNMKCTTASVRVSGRSCAAAVQPCQVPRCVRARAAEDANATVISKKRLESQVERWFHSLSVPSHPIDGLVAKEARLIDNTNQACYKGYAAMKHRMQSVHESLPDLVEVSDVVDTEHNCVAAHWKAHGKSGEVTGTYVFKFDSAGMIEEILAYQDSDEDEFLEA